MRIASGRYKGRNLAYPRVGLRPTKNVTRQAIFNVLGRRLAGARVCDLYAGGGSLGIEALSRGARAAVFVEDNPAVVRFLRQNVKGLELVRVIRGDVLKVLPRLKGERFDLVLADPPYCHGLVQPTIDLVARLDVLGPGGWFVVEHHELERPVCPDNWEVVKQGRYGESWVTIMRRQQ